MHIVSAGATDPGKKRGNNEDAFTALDEAGLYVVADGVGGNEGGEVASRIAVETFAAIVPGMVAGNDRNGPSSRGNSEFDALLSAVERANSAIREEGMRRPEISGMATTLTALLFKNGRAFLIHVGDSRAYLLRSGELRQLSSDHTLVSEYVRDGLLTPEEAHVSPYRHVITRSLGSGEEAAPDTAAQAVQAGDVFLLCTDGLTEMVSDKEILDILAANAPKAAQKFINAANRAGGVDNITAVVIQVAAV